MRNYKDIKNSRTPEEDFIFQFKSKLVGMIIIQRKKMKLSQIDLAEIVGIEQSAVSRIETWETIPNLDTIFKIAHALNIDIQIIPPVGIDKDFLYFNCSICNQKVSFNTLYVLPNNEKQSYDIFCSKHGKEQLRKEETNGKL